MLESNKTFPPSISGAEWVTVAVMGVTGSGKSTFIKIATGSPDVEIGHSLESCTSEMRGYSFHHKGKNINLVDTPGFNDTHKSETEVLQEIAAWLKTSYKQSRKLHGVIYLHSINNPRMEGSALRNLRMFRQLCGDDPLKNVILATSFWDKVSEQLGAERESELRIKPEFWGRMIQRGSQVTRFTDCDSALKIVELFFPKAPIALEIQLELVDQSKRLVETAAGKSVKEELNRLEKKHENELQKIKEEYILALQEKDKELQETLQDAQRKIDRDLDKIHRQQEQLRAERRADDRRRKNEFDLQIQKMQNISAINLSEPHEALVNIEDISFNDLVGKIRANQIKIKPEDRDKVERIIRDAEKRDDLSSSLKRKAKGTAKILAQILQLAVPIVSLTLLGLPIFLPDYSQLMGTD
ncbi:hypothetical protein N7540_005099 [Penicillium herquei]|nr:hypothetical protein N7540_005099 [Penicillium herquei]